MAAQGTRYSVTLPPPVEEDLEVISQELHTSKAEVLRRSLMLFKHAIRADRVELYKGEGEDEISQQVLLK